MDINKKHLTYLVNATIVVILMVVMSAVMTSCAPAKEINRKLDALSQRSEESNRIDSLFSHFAASVNKNINSFKESQGEKVIERHTVMYLPPDSSGTQYKASEERYLENNKTQESEKYSEQYSAYFEQLLTKISQMEAKIEELSKIKEDVKVENISWWKKVKMEAGGIAIGVLAVLLIYFIVKIAKSVKSVGWKAALKLIFGK